MSTTIDQRVVEMRFDNKQFEANVSDTMSSLDKLKQSLNLKGASKGLEEVNTAAKKVDMSGLGSAVETVQAKFSALQVIGVTALANLTNSAVNAGKRIVSALTIDPVKTGLSEYETKINAVQTILANTESKGTTMADVTKTLGELNAYADKTIYNFAEMTRNIGTFTAAGIGLEESATAIQGIANLAAISGSNSQQASTAMYQLSQAMASGTVKLMDWNSVVNAGMGGQVFQDALKNTAKNHGVNVDAMIKKNGSFRESLQEGWITTEILTETLAKMTKGGAAEYLSKLTGVEQKQIEAAQKLVAENKDGAASYEELAKQLAATGKVSKDEAMSILKMADTAEDAATKVKTFTQLWDTLKEAAQSGWSQTWEILIGDFEEAKETLTKISDVIGEVINKSAESRNELLKGWKDAGGRADLVDSLFNTIEAIGSVVKPIKEAFSEIFPPITVQQLVDFTKGLKELTSRMKLSDETSDKLKRTFKGLFAIADIVKQLFSAMFEVITPLFKGVNDLSGGLLGMSASIGDWLVNLSDTIRKTDIFGKVLGGIADVVKAALGVVKKFIKAIKDNIAAPGFNKLHSFLGKIKERMSGLGDVASAMKDAVVRAFDAIGDALSKCSFIGFLEIIWKIVKTVGSAIGKVFSGIAKGISGMLGDFDLNELIKNLNGLLAGGIFASIISFLNKSSDGVTGFLDMFKDGIGGIVDNITGVFGSLQGCLQGFQESLKADALMKIAKAIIILAAALLILSAIDNDRLMGAIGAITVLFTELMTAMNVVSKLDSGGGLVKMGFAIGKLASALLILSIALAIISTLSPDKLGIGLTAIAVGLGALVGAVNLLPESKVNSAAKAIKTMSTSLLILSVALKIMSTMSWEEMGVGLVTMAVGLGLLVAAVNLLPKDTSLKVAGMVGLATAMVLLGAALKIMGTLSWEEVGRALVAMAGAMVIIVSSLNLMMSALPGAAAMLIVAPALVIMAAALKIMGTLSWEEIGKGLATMAGALLILAVGLTSMIAALPGAAALIVAVGALALLTPVLLLLGAMSWESIIKGLVSIAGAITIIGVAGALLAPYVPAILGLAGAIALVGVGTLAAGVGLMAFSAGLTGLAVAATAIVGSLSAIVTIIIGLVSAVIEGILTGIANGIIALCGIIANGAPAIMEALTAIIVSVCDAIVASIPSLLNAARKLLDALIALIREFVPKLVDLGLDLIMGLLRGIAAKLPDIIQAATDIIVAFIRGIGKCIPQVVDAGFKMIIDFINGMANAIRDNNQALIDAVNNLMDAAIDAILDWVENAMSAGGDIIQGVIDGVKNMAGGLWDAMVSVASSAWDGFLEFFGINSPAKKGIAAGKFIDKGLIVGLETYSKNVDKAALGVGEGAMNALNDSIGGIADVVNGDLDSQPTIRPVLDLSDVRAGASDISKIFGTGASVGVEANVGAISSSMNKRNQNGGSDDVVSAINKLGKKLDGVGNTTYTVNGVTYDDGSNITEAVKTIIRAARVERRTH